MSTWASQIAIQLPKDQLNLFAVKTFLSQRATFCTKKSSLSNLYKSELAEFDPTTRANLKKSKPIVFDKLAHRTKVPCYGGCWVGVGIKQPFYVNKPKGQGPRGTACKIYRHLRNRIKERNNPFLTFCFYVVPW